MKIENALALLVLMAGAACWAVIIKGIADGKEVPGDEQ